MKQLWSEANANKVRRDLARFGSFLSHAPDLSTHLKISLEAGVRSEAWMQRPMIHTALVDERGITVSALKCKALHSAAIDLKNNASLWLSAPLDDFFIEGRCVPPGVPLQVVETPPIPPKSPLSEHDRLKFFGLIAEEVRPRFQSRRH